MSSSPDVAVTAFLFHFVRCDEYYVLSVLHIRATSKYHETRLGLLLQTIEQAFPIEDLTLFSLFIFYYLEALKI